MNIKAKVRGLEATEMAIIPLLVRQTRSARLKFVKRYKSVAVDRDWDDYLSVFG